MAFIAMRENRLYIMEGTVPKGYPEPGLFYQSLGWVDKDGNGIRYQQIYVNEIYGLGLFPEPGHNQGGQGGRGAGAAGQVTATRGQIDSVERVQSPKADPPKQHEVAMKRMLAIIVAATTFLSLHAAAQNSTLDAGAVINAATTAMGTARLRSVQYTGTGSTNPTGQAYTTGGPWPRYTVTRYTMSIDYSLPAMRQELVRIDDAKSPRGGGAGGYNPATFQGGIRPIPGDIIQNRHDRRRDKAGAIAFWLTPHGFLKGAPRTWRRRRRHRSRQEDGVVHRVRQVPDHRHDRRPQRNREG